MSSNGGMEEDLEHDEDDEIRAYFRGRKLHSVGHRDERLREALAEVVRIATEQRLAASHPGQHEPSIPYEPPEDIVIQYGNRHEVNDQLGRRNKADRIRPDADERAPQRELDMVDPPIAIRVPPSHDQTPVTRISNQPSYTRPAMDGLGISREISGVRGQKNRVHIDDELEDFGSSFDHVNSGSRSQRRADDHRLIRHQPGVEFEGTTGIPEDEQVHRHEPKIAVPSVHNPSFDFLSPELERLIADVRADPSLHVPESRYDRAYGTRTPGEGDIRFTPEPGDIIVRARPLPDGSFVQYYTRDVSPLQAGDRLIRIFIDNSTDFNQTELFSELHMCLGNEGGPSPRFLYFGKAEEITSALRG
ncbi:hypothetical protein R1flu_024096 [Riccia fluitans]|uniref:Uncharacterized protein n=1 Tax=Riccia fluitans TaxID=41844 RepID=A0ABD1XUD2_9MARC